MTVIGKLADLPLTSLIQVTCQEGRSAQLRLWREDQHGIVYFEQGRVVHAQLGANSGEEAIYSLLTWQDGKFALERQTKAYGERTITVDWSHLLLEGVSRMDEEAAPPEDEPETADNAPATEAIAAMVSADADSDSEVQAVLEEVADALPSFISAVVIATDGMGLYHHTKGDHPPMGDNFFLMMSMVSAIEARATETTVQDFCLRTTANLVVGHYLSSGHWLGVVTATEANLSEVHATIADYEGALLELLETNQ